jgi:hypothetical protein
VLIFIVIAFILFEICLFVFCLRELAAAACVVDLAWLSMRGESDAIDEDEELLGMLSKPWALLEIE